MKSSVVLFLGFSILVANAGENLVANSGFEMGTNGWRAWSRDVGVLTTSLDSQEIHSGRFALRLVHHGQKDWSVEPAVLLDVQPGDIVRLECWVKAQGSGSVSLCASTWDKEGRVISWSAGDQTASAPAFWQHLGTRVIATENARQFQPRLIGYGPSEVWLDDFLAAREGNLSQLRAANLPGHLVVSNQVLAVDFNTRDANFSARDLRVNRTWEQKAFSSRFVVRTATVQSNQIQSLVFDAITGAELGMVAQLDSDLPEMTLVLSGHGECPSSIPLPHPFASAAGDYLVIPMNEGISYPVDDASISPMRLIAYGGHGICMGFYGVTDGSRGHMAILETPDDAAIRIDRIDGRLVVAPEWDSRLGQFGYARRIRYVFLDRGGHVAMAKRYRRYATEIGLRKTLSEKRAGNPNIDRLVGAVNVWCWERDSVGIVKEMQALGIDRILWSNQQPPERLRELNDLGVLTSRYDIYQDVMAPTNFPRVRWIHPDWTTNAWPQDIIVNRRGDWLRGWGVEARDGSLIP
ncbi:MAG TPA: hypothetical protein VKY92_16810, partial [Verrucomicrobiae bacterium]|nr:hypothetical protein [Verrucomicrobiae bacterium]